MHLILIRHGQSYVNLPDWAGGNVDAELTETGLRQAAALAAWLPGHLPQVDVIYGSTLRRAVETVTPLAAAYGQPIRFDDRIREISSNRLDHTPYPNNDLPKDFTEFWATEFPFATVIPTADRGETYMHFRARVGIFLEEMVAAHARQTAQQTVLAVCHGGVIDAMFDNMFNVGPYRRCEIWTSNTGVTHFELVEIPGREAWRLRYQNRVAHLLATPDDIT
ncbi:MAG: histidine phosphatase family protein [Caldilineaceae bacterium]|nr:histidine phosphatase family protein [Caldilineaceae bacterium]MBP8109856.1 histidine phosphatase family protein [Caldilineaceae bacterium]MBP8124565.1 histidine phosphatase family protein [Caldilineaceae bacterium]MBP9074476.1 histidine phosphatase family protein [Caldilineaceae bacterium]